MTVHGLGYNQEKLEIGVLFRAAISFEVMDSCWNMSHNQHAAEELWAVVVSRRSSHETFQVWEQWGCWELYLGTDKTARAYE